MGDITGQLLIIGIGGLVSGGGALAVWLQSRASRAVGVKSADVEADKSAGQLALDIANHVSGRLTEQDEKIDRLEEENEKTRADLEIVRGELRSVLAEVESIARDLRRFVEWEEAGAQGAPPISLSDIYARLEALNRKRPTP